MIDDPPTPASGPDEDDGYRPGTFVPARQAALSPIAWVAAVLLGMSLGLTAALFLALILLSQSGGQ